MTRRVRGALPLGPVAAVLAGAVLPLAGCGSDASTPPRSSGTVSAGEAAAFPLTLDRSGGIAGFRDRLTIAADGHVTGRTSGGTVDCTTDPALAATLAGALGSASGTPRPGSDQIAVTLSGGGRQVSLGEASSGDAAARAANELLNAVQQPPPAGGRCHGG